MGCYKSTENKTNYLEDREEKENVIEKLIFQKDFLFSFSKNDFQIIYWKIEKNVIPAIKNINVDEEIILFFMEKYIWNQYQEDERFLICILKLFNILSNPFKNLEKLCESVINFIFSSSIQNNFPKITVDLISQLIIIAGI